MDFLPGLIHGTIELMFLDPLPSILLDQTRFQFGLTFGVQLQFERLSLLCGCHTVWVCEYVCVVLSWSHSFGLTVATLTPVQFSLPDPEPLNTRLASITLTDCFLNVDKKDYLSASAWVAEQVINTKHFPYCTSSLNVELTPVSVCCQQGAIYPGLIDRTRAWPRPSETSAAPHNTNDH